MWLPQDLDEKSRRYFMHEVFFLNSFAMVQASYMNQIEIHSKLTLFNLNVGYNITGTHSNFGNVLRKKQI